VILYPAIDIMGGSAVRLVKGNFAAKKVYDEDPLSAARAWVRAGAERLHVVDLDGARAGSPVNLDHLRRIAGELAVPVQYGGGLRTVDAVREALAAGAARAILGTAAFTDPGLLERALAEHGPERVLVSVDVRGGRVATAGWTHTTEMAAAQVVESLHERGVGELVYTNVDRDGMLEGPDLEEVRAIARAVRGRLLYSGGIGSLADLEGLAALGEHTLEGVIVGKALYEERFTVAAARAALGG
jgi:phosphoribosylformimino-5-aminoimidazole carboxamide ribotide isomerase